MGKDDDLFPFPIGIILLFIFFIALATGMSIEAIIGIIGIVVVILLAGWSGFYKVFLKRKLEDLEKIRKNHLKDIVTILEDGLGTAHIYLGRFRINITYQSPAIGVALPVKSFLPEK